MTPNQLKRYRSWFGWVFLVSVSMLAAVSAGPETVIVHWGWLTFEFNPQLWISVATLLTSVTSLVGFFFTTALALRRERREKQHSDVELEKNKLEVEKLRPEVERNKKQPSAPGQGSNDVG